MRYFPPGERVGWPATAQGDFARRYLTPVLREGASVYVANAHARVGVVGDGEVALPVTLDPAEHDSYVVSPLSHYVHYAREEVAHLEGRGLRTAAHGVLRGAHVLLERAAVERTVYVNSWLLSTNLWPALSPTQIRKLVRALLSAFPDRPVAMRSVDAGRNALLLAVLLDEGFVPVFSRRVWYMDPRTPGFWRNRQLREDRRRLRDTPFEEVPGEHMTDDDLTRARELYNLLYLQRYSTLNPQFTPEFFRTARELRLLDLRGYRTEGPLAAVFGSLCAHGVITQPIFGYDTAAPREPGLYRLLTLRSLQHARERGLLMNASAGAGKFKAVRGAVPVNEYMLVRTRHLSAARRAAWRSLAALLDRAVIPLMQRQQL